MDDQEMDDHESKWISLTDDKVFVEYNLEPQARASRAFKSLECFAAKFRRANETVRKRNPDVRPPRHAIATEMGAAQSTVYQYLARYKRQYGREP